MILLAIDPGAKGAYAVQSGTYPDDAVGVSGFSSESDFCERMQWLAQYASERGECITCYLEQVGGYVGQAQPGSAMFKFGRNFGFILGVCQALGMRIELVRPQAWQKCYPTKTSKTENGAQHKRELKDHAARLYPGKRVTLGNADALLILDYAKKKEGK